MKKKDKNIELAVDLNGRFFDVIRNFLKEKNKELTNIPEVFALAMGLVLETQASCHIDTVGELDSMRYIDYIGDKAKNLFIGNIKENKKEISKRTIKKNKKIV